MVFTEVVVPDKTVKENYIVTWCKDAEGIWGNCTRYLTKKSLGFCPDFVVPDTPLTVDEIIEKFDAIQEKL